MSTIEAVLPWISSLDLGPLSHASSPGVVVGPPPDRAAPGDGAAPASVRQKVGTCSLRQIVDCAVAEAEREVIQRALTATLGNKSRAARLLRTNYTTLHAKMKRYGISAQEFRG